MPAIAIKISALPKSTFGGGRESAPRVAVGENGQIRFSTSLTKDVIGPCEKIYITFDPDTRELGMRPVLTAPKGTAEEDLQPIKRGKDGESKQAYFGAAALLSFPDCGIKYDFRKSGTQVFEPRIAKNKAGDATTMYITLPEGALPPRPKQERAKKAPTTPAPAPAKAPVASAVDDDID